MDKQEGVIVGRSSIDTQTLADLLRGVAVGEVIEYGALSAAIGRDITMRRDVLERARRRVMRENNMVFGTLINVGLKRLDDIETISFVNQHRRLRIRSQASKAIREIGTVDYGKLPRESQVSHNAGMALFGAIHASTESTHLKTLETQVANDQLPDTSGTLAMVGWLSE